MSEEIKYTREEFMNMVKIGIAEMNKQFGCKKILRSADYVTLGKMGIALQFYDEMENKKKSNETENS